jgi:hypothetical protein
VPAFQNVLDSRSQQAHERNAEVGYIIAWYVTWKHSQDYFPLAGQDRFGSHRLHLPPAD